MSGVSPDAGLSTGTAPTVRVENLPRLERPESTSLAITEAERLVALLSGLGPDGWARPTDCALWDVRAMTGHVLGMAQTFSGLRRFATTMRAGAKAAGDGPMIDGLTAVQVTANAGLDNAELIAQLEATAPVQARWRARRRLMRRIPMKQQLNDGSVETWKFGYLVDIILTRDSWMHRVDISRATGRPLDLTAAHDGRLVADVVAEWARRHGKPFTLQLTGPAGGSYTVGGGGEELTLDAVEFCRTLSGRMTGTGLLAQEVPF
jgi:uncharacterized protein (TIGR03083 family)